MIANQFESEVDAEVMIEELDTRLEMGLWIFDTHDGETASCGYN